MHRKGLILTTAATVGITGAGVTTSACGGTGIVTVNPTTSPTSPAATAPPAAAPPATTPPATPRTTTAPATPPATTPAPSPSTVYVPAPGPTRPQVTNPWAVVSAYYGDIESANYAEAWSFLSPSMQARLGPYDAWVAGYQTTVQTSVSELGQSGDTVTINITAEESDGSSRSYTGYYTVSNGKITSAHITED